MSENIPVIEENQSKGYIISDIYNGVFRASQGNYVKLLHLD